MTRVCHSRAGTPPLRWSARIPRKRGKVSVPFESVQGRAGRKTLLIPVVLAALILVGVSSASPNAPAGAGRLRRRRRRRTSRSASTMAVPWSTARWRRTSSVRSGCRSTTSLPSRRRSSSWISSSARSRAADQRGLRVILSISPGHNTDVTRDPNGVKKFAAYTALVARAFPSVTDFVIGNEPNLGTLLVSDVQPRTSRSQPLRRTKRRSPRATTRSRLSTRTST